DGVPFIHLNHLWEELEVIQAEFSKRPGSCFVWDWEHPDSSAPENQAGLHPEATLDKTYISERGQTVFDLIFEMKQYSDAFQSGIRIVITDLTDKGVKSTFRIPKELKAH
ncbi:hypothetical protein SB749_18850, partial [Brevibacterium sp. SIMBA_078]|uniref:hypothetical protein n=1 Tax=Brevibacterium sp. SIMBA_078 TaxID=3085816 RepID=UPI00397D6A4B